MTRFVTLDTRTLPGGARQDAIDAFLAAPGFDLGISDLAATGRAYQVVGKALVGARNAIGMVALAGKGDPSHAPWTRSNEPDRVFLLAGSSGVTYHLDDQRVPLQQGRLLIADNRRSYSVEFTPGTWRCFVSVLRSDLSFTRRDIDQMASGPGLGDQWQSQLFVRTARAIHELKSVKRQPDAVSTDRYVAALAEMMLRSHSGLSRVGCRMSAEERRRVAEDYIRDHVASRTLTPETVAHHLGMSLRQLTRVFASGPGVAATIQRARLLHADEMLRSRYHANLTTAEVAQASGFVSAAHFSRVYKAAYGVTPSQARLASAS
jgi:AraC-like DNA-binding protein